jgi:uncharacterized membrane protein (DUF485 family)
MVSEPNHRRNRSSVSDNEASASDGGMGHGPMRRSTVVEVIITSLLSAGGIVAAFTLLWLVLPLAAGAPFIGILIGVVVLVVAIGGIFLLFQSDVTLKRRQEESQEVEGY